MLALLLSRRFAPLFWCQFFAAFSDNFLKTALVFLILFRLGAGGAALITLAAAVFIAPFFFLSGLGGELADRFDKARVAQRLKFSEIAVAALAVAGFGLQSIPIMFAALFLFGVIAALFGPIKYGILPDHLTRAELPGGNALIEGATFLAILLGTIAGGIAARGGGNVALVAALIIGFALACWGASLLIPSTREAAPHLAVRRNIAASTLALIRHLHGERRLWWGALMTSWFWLVGVVTLSLLPPLVTVVMGGDDDGVTACLALFSVAIGIGAGLAALLARGRIVLWPSLAGAALMGLFALDLAWASSGGAATLQGAGLATILVTPRGMHVALDLAGLAIAGGLYVVPVFAAVQAWAAPDQRARVVAGVNVLNAAFMAGSTVIVALLQLLGLSTPSLFALLGSASLGVALIIARTMPAADHT